MSSKIPVNIRVTTPSGKRVLIVAAPEDIAVARKLARQLRRVKKVKR